MEQGGQTSEMKSEVRKEHGAIERRREHGARKTEVGDQKSEVRLGERRISDCGFRIANCLSLTSDL
jgi:hypothetical protein